MNVARLAEAKRLGHSHSAEEIRSVVHAYSRGDVPDSEMTIWAKAVYLQGMTDEEIVALVDAMISSGATIDFRTLSRFVADKHSTGGVGDKVSLILGPLMAAAGLVIPMISGRSLGHTGGTLDKLESIPGYRVDLTVDDFRRIVGKVGISMMGQTDQICPADKKMYALRDAIGTTKSIPFICGSIMSKKIAEGIDGLVLDVKVGNGAFMKTVREAKELSEKLVMVANHFGIHIDIAFSDMNQPLGNEAGLFNEIQESILALRGEGPADLMEVTFKLGGALLMQAGMATTQEEAITIQSTLIHEGHALRKFTEMVEAHGGDVSSLQRPDYHARNTFRSGVVAHRTGYLTEMDTLEIGLAVNGLTVLGTGRGRQLDESGGVHFEKKTGDKVTEGETLAVCTGRDYKKVKQSAVRIAEAMHIGEERVEPPGLFPS